MKVTKDNPIKSCGSTIVSAIHGSSNSNSSVAYAAVAQQEGTQKGSPRKRCRRHDTNDNYVIFQY